MLGRSSKKWGGQQFFGKNPSHELQEYWPFSCDSIANNIGKPVFVKSLCRDCALHAWPLRVNKHISLIACLINFCFWLLGILSWLIYLFIYLFIYLVMKLYTVCINLHTHIYIYTHTTYIHTHVHVSVGQYMLQHRNLYSCLDGLFGHMFKKAMGVHISSYEDVFQSHT